VRRHWSDPRLLYSWCPTLLALHRQCDLHLLGIEEGGVEREKESENGRERVEEDRRGSEREREEKRREREIEREKKG
jgi:hypothetical protein